MSRSKWKLCNTNFIIKKKEGVSKIFIKQRSKIIPSSLINKRVFIHSGHKFRAIFLVRKNVGFKFGELVFTRQKPLLKPKRPIKSSK